MRITDLHLSDEDLYILRTLLKDAMDTQIATKQHIQSQIIVKEEKQQYDRVEAYQKDIVEIDEYQIKLESLFASLSP